jgi:hypothetical protein
MANDPSSAGPETQIPDPAPTTRSRTGRWIALVAVVLVLVLGAGAWAVMRLLGGGGPLPVTAMPANTLAEVSLDLDPAAGQKVNALRTLRKFPDLRKQLELDSTEDLRRQIFIEIAGKKCVGDFAERVQPWLGSRVAIGVLMLHGEPTPEVALQVTDRDKAAAGLGRILKCAGTDDIGFAVGEQYAILSTSDADARAIVAAATKKSLADDPAYQRWIEAAGGRGVINGYIAAQAPKQFLKMIPDDLPEEQTAQVTEMFKGFQGAGLSVRFESDGFEADLVRGARGPAARQTIGADVARLPDDSAAALGFAVPQAALESLTDGFLSGFAGAVGPGSTRRFEQMTGLDPDKDVRTLVGHGLVGVIGGTPPANLASDDVPPDLQAAIVLTGDAAKIDAVVRKILAAFHVKLSDIGISSAEDDRHVVFGRDPSFNRSLLEDGRLGDQEDFRAVIAHPQQAQAIFFARLNDAWRKAIVATIPPSNDGSDLEGDLKPLRAFGVSGWSEVSGKDVIAHVRSRLLLH